MSTPAASVAPREGAAYLQQHRAHDPRFLIRRWRAVARSCGLAMHSFATAAEHPVYVLKTPALGKQGGIYLSAGIHGDEPAGTEALIFWAEQNLASLSQMPLLIFPCLNPWGLLNNTRFNEDGVDLNRVFQHDDVQVVRFLKASLVGHRFVLSLMLHEDYDARGVYIYEVQRLQPYWGEDLLAAAQQFLPIEGRLSIEGRRAKAGIVRRRIAGKGFPMLPEAVHLHRHHSDRTFTLETPSEFSLDLRIRALAAVVEECVARAIAQPKHKRRP